MEQGEGKDERRSFLLATAQLQEMARRRMFSQELKNFLAVGIKTKRRISLDAFRWQQHEAQNMQLQESYLIHDTFDLVL